MRTLEKINQKFLPLFHTRNLQHKKRILIKPEWKEGRSRETHCNWDDFFHSIYKKGKKTVELSSCLSKNLSNCRGHHHLLPQSYFRFRPGGLRNPRYFRRQCRPRGTGSSARIHGFVAKSD